MTQNFFWMNKYEYAASGGKGFSVFSVPHLIWLAALLSGIVLLEYFYRKSKDSRRKNIRNVIALFLIFFEITKQCIVVLTGAPALIYLPLHICSFAEYVILIDAFWPDNRIFKPLLCYTFLPSAFMALVLPTATAYHPLSFYSIHHFILHAGIVAYIIARYASGEMRISYKGVWISFIAIFILIIPIYYIDAAFDANFAFLMGHGNNPALKFIWDLTGGTGGIPYIAGLGVLVLIAFHVTYGIFAAIHAIGKKRS